MQIRDLVPWGRHERQDAARSLAPHRPRDAGADPFTALQREVNQLFDSAFKDFGPTFGAGGEWPRIEVSETAKAVRVKAELPGMDEKDVEVSFADGLLTLRGEKRSDVEDKERHYSEHSYGRFERTIHIPLAIDENGMEAVFKKGMLTVTLPKSKAQQEGVRRIPILTQ